MMHPILIALLLGCVVIFAACLTENDVKMTFVNESDALLCFNLSSEYGASGTFCDKIKPRATSVWRPGCSTSGERPVTVVLNAGQGGREVYNRTATCNEWKESGAKFTIEQRGDEFVVTDSLPSELDTPISNRDSN
ncbi:MAG: hypothetical protein IIA91_10805 [Chloroflexi bacterium]|nr:hypothetical protein [Chloroflexota bacterium]